MRPKVFIRTALVIAALFVLAGCTRISTNLPPINKSLPPNDAVNLIAATSSPVSINTKEKAEIPNSFILPVPFAPQAPFADWSPLYNEACEEAAMIMVVKYFKNEPLDKEIMNEEILKLVKWEEENGYKIDLTAQEVVEVLAKYFKLKARVVKIVTPQLIKEELVRGNLIIVPAAGRQLGNPYFRRPGPLYHMLVIKGYDSRYFITNDPGTKRGEGYKYKYQQLLNAVHDWNKGEVDKGQKVLILVSP